MNHAPDSVIRCRGSYSSWKGSRWEKVELEELDELGKPVPIRRGLLFKVA